MIKSRTQKPSILMLLCIFYSVIFLSGCKEEPVVDITEGRPTMRILFVGNDFTFMNNMPYMVQLLAQTDPTAHFKVEVDMHVAQDASLAQLWNNPFTREILTSSSWDYIVIQPHHMWATTEGSVYLTRKSISAWNSQIRQVRAQPVLFMTWPLEPTHSAYTDPNNPKLKNYKNMHRLIRGYTKALAEEMDLFVVPVGDYWMASMASNSVNLYNPDRFAPSVEGSYLAALVFYKMLVDHTLEDVQYIPEGMSPETQAALISVVSKKIK